MTCIRSNALMALVLTFLLADLLFAGTLMAAFPMAGVGIEVTLGFFGITLLMACLTWVLARQSAQNARQAQEFKRLLGRDKLTDAATRDLFFERMEASPDASGVALMVDIDHFKQINDRFGHLAGDAVIRDVARVLRENTRRRDIVCRFGGEEFLIFLDGADAETGRHTAERLRREVARNVIAFNGEALNATVSVGAVVKCAETHIERAIHDADGALYRAKRLGRNRTVMAGTAAAVA